MQKHPSSRQKDKRKLYISYTLVFFVLSSYILYEYYSSGKIEENPEKIFKEFSDENRGLDVVVECVGLPEIWELAFNCVRPGGTVHFFGGCKSGSNVCFDTTKMHYNDIKLMSVFHHTPKYFRQALELIASGKIEVEKLITETLPLEKVEYAMQRHIEGSAIKFLIRP